jgi:hypothetical protein
MRKPQCGRFGYSDLKEASGVCGGCGFAMGFESTFSCKLLINIELATECESLLDRTALAYMPFRKIDAKCKQIALKLASYLHSHSLPN